ncbi:MAG: outer membrane beta-barrel protein [Polyangiaceae bacterium]|jgi:hypothetical protein
MRSAIAAAVILFSVPARADGTFFEGDVGLMSPIADDDYETAIDSSFKLGLRVGSGSAGRAFDVSYDFTPASDDINNAIADIDFQRHRVMFGARYVHPINPKANFFLRGAIGLDLIRETGTVLGQDFSETDLGLGLEVHAGVLFDLSPKLSIGGKLGIPFAFHFDDDDPDDPDDSDLEYTGVDLDVAFLLNVKF